MSASTFHPVLIVGGSGYVGSQAVKILRRLHPELPIAIGGRDLRKAEAVAASLGKASAVAVDLSRADLGLPAGSAYSAVAMFVKDEGLGSLRYAQAAGIPYLDIQTALFEFGPLVAQSLARADRSAVLLGSSWLSGATVFPTLTFAKEFRSIERIEVGVIIDDQDLGGPAAFADFQRYTETAPNPLTYEAGQWRWIKQADSFRTFRDSEGVEVRGQMYAALDVLSAAIGTTARSARFDFAMGTSATRRRGEPLSAETIIEIVGERAPGRTERVRYEILHPEGQAPVTGLGAMLGIERLLGLAGGEPVRPGLYMVESLIEAPYFLERLTQFGSRIRRV